MLYLDHQPQHLLLAEHSLPLQLPKVHDKLSIQPTLQDYSEHLRAVHEGGQAGQEGGELT